MEFISLCCRAESFAALHRIFPRVFLHFVSDYFMERPNENDGRSGRLLDTLHGMCVLHIRV